MVRLEDIVGKPLGKVAGGAYDRVFDDVEFSRLLSRIQSLIIKNGYDLERIITQGIESLLIDDLNEFLSIQIMQEGIRVAKKSVIKKCNKIEGHSIEPDFLIFQRTSAEQNCYIVELKDGHEFDTKSSAKEQANLHTFVSKNAMALNNFQSYCKIVGFNARNKEQVKIGFKHKIALEQAMTGEEFCKLLKLDYKKIVHQRKADAKANFDHFINELFEIDTVSKAIANRLKS